MDRILIVEDDRFFREFFSDLLRSQNYQVDCAACGTDALKMLQDHHYGLVVTDLVMPDLSGMELLSRIKENDPSIDVIMVTGHANLESAIFALKHGAYDYLIKPVNEDEFLHSVAQCLEQRRILDENQELKGMLHLFQSSQTIAGCLDIERVYHLMLDALAREVGVGRGMGLFLTGTTLEIKEVKGISTAEAEPYRDVVLNHVNRSGLGSRLITRLDHLGTGQDETGIEEAYLLFMRHKGLLQGVIVMFNDHNRQLPEIEARKKNILFLLEQSVRAFDNASSYTLAKDMLFIDDLSGLYNYRYLEIALDRELKRIERYASQLSVLFLDLDSFKQINDTHGHLVGSRVLQEMGLLLKKSVREVDIVIRYGGDEFTIILVETGPEASRSVAERIRALVAGHVFLAAEGYDIRVTCSIGYSCCPDDALSKQELLDMADKAMYAGKNSGKNCVTRFTKHS